MRVRPSASSLLLAALLLAPLAAGAGEADVLAVKVTQTSAGLYRFDVTLRHADEGWAHYADRWEVLDADGRVLKTRVLLHPHVHEQPFTRSQHGVMLPDGVARVRMRAHDKVHGWGGAEQILAIPR